jgi:exodeoxyribonuclease-5
MPVFTPHQDAALTAVADWYKAKPGRNGTPAIFRLFGYAGTGKTTLARISLRGRRQGPVRGLHRQAPA